MTPTSRPLNDAKSTMSALCAYRSAGNPSVTLTFSPAADTTLYEEGDLSNGGGERLFAGTTLSGNLRRALIAFDLSGIPQNAVIEDVTLEMVMSRALTGTLVARLHRLTNAWGEGTVDAPGQEGGGAPAEPGDATWLHRSFPTTLWDQPGGDFDPVESASTPVFPTLGPYQWSDPGMIADVQQWVANPGSNHGWLVRGSESGANGSAKRFDSREIMDPATAPVLTVTLRVPPAIPVPALSAWSYALIVLLIVGITAAFRLRP